MSLLGRRVFRLARERFSVRGLGEIFAFIVRACYFGIFRVLSEERSRGRLCFGLSLLMFAFSCLCWGLLGRSRLPFRVHF